MKTRVTNTWKKLGVTCMCATLLMGATGMFASAATYTAYVLPILQGNNYTSIHDKTTADNFITNEVTAITDAVYADFWAINSNNNIISLKYKQGVGTGQATIKITTSGYNYIGAQVGMGMENHDTSLTRGFVSGTVYFR